MYCMLGLSSFVLTSNKYENAQSEIQSEDEVIVKIDELRHGRVI